MDNKAHLWRAWWKERVEPKIPVLHSLQMRLALGYSALIAALLILMNTYPLLMSQNLMFRSQQTALANQAVVITNALTTADQLTPAGVEQSLSQVEDLNVQRILITDEAGLVLYDSQENGVAGKYALTGEVVAALRGNDAFSSAYQDGLFSSRGAWPSSGPSVSMRPTGTRGPCWGNCSGTCGSSPWWSAWRCWPCSGPFRRSSPAGCGRSWAVSGPCGKGSTPTASPCPATMSWPSWRRNSTSSPAACK